MYKNVAFVPKMLKLPKILKTNTPKNVQFGTKMSKTVQKWLSLIEDAFLHKFSHSHKNECAQNLNVKITTHFKQNDY